MAFTLLAFLLSTGFGNATICVTTNPVVRKLRGIVVARSDHRVMPGVEIRVFKRKRSGAEVEVEAAISDDDGYFHFPRLGPGAYIIAARLEGFEKTTGHVRISRGSIGGDRVLIVEMEVASTTSCGNVRTATIEEARRLQRNSSLRREGDGVERRGRHEVPGI